MQIALLVPDQTANPRYRAVIPMQALAERGHQIGVAEVGGPAEIPPLEALAAYDVVYIWRMYHAPLRRLVRALRARRVATIWDNDDDLTSLPKGAPGYGTFGGAERLGILNEVKSMIRGVDAVTTPSPVLADKFRRAGQSNVHVIENYLPSAAGGARGERRKGRVTVGWVAGAEHVMDLTQLKLTEVFRQVLEARPEVQLSSVGIPLGLGGVRYSNVKHVDLDELPGAIAQFDIGIAPLVDMPFNRARSNVKVKEYAGGGVPWLASPIGPYAELGEEQGGRLVEDDQWAEALLELIDDGRARKALSRKASAWAQQETIDRHAHRWESVLDDAIRRVRRNAA